MSGHFLPRVQARKDFTRKFLDKLGPMPEGQTKRGWTTKVFKMLIKAGADYEDNHAGYLLFAYDKMGHVGASKEGGKRMEYDGRVKRRTKEEIADFHKLVVDIVEEQKPMTVRAVYYQMEVRHPKIISKDDDGAYNKVQAPSPNFATLARSTMTPSSTTVDAPLTTPRSTASKIFLTPCAIGTIATSGSITIAA
jgi:hypothetical protein